MNTNMGGNFLICISASLSEIVEMVTAAGQNQKVSKLSKVSVQKLLTIWLMAPWINMLHSQLEVSTAKIHSTRDHDFRP